jgi:hypothetical protein
MAQYVINLPVVLSFGDYHDIDNFAEDVSRLGLHIKAKEIHNYNDVFPGRYYGLFYVGRCPDKKTINSLLESCIKEN